MNNLTVVENKISGVRKYLKILERYKPYSVKEIEKDIDIRGALERYLYLMVQESIHLAESFIAYKQFRKPITLSESFYILHEENIINETLMDKMIKMTGFRNVVAHDYDKINYAIIHTVLHKGVKDIESLIKQIQKHI